MKAWEIVAYTYDADIHCPHCTPNELKEADAEDSEGNPVHPVFASDEYYSYDPPTHCCDCGDEI